MTSVTFLGLYRQLVVDKNDITLTRLTDRKSIILSKQDFNILMDIHEKVMTAVKNKKRFFQVLSRTTHYAHSIEVHIFEGHGIIIFIETKNGKRKPEITSVGLLKQHYEKLFDYVKSKRT
jgi:hypothetical protein